MEVSPWARRPCLSFYEKPERAYEGLVRNRFLEAERREHKPNPK